MPLCWKPHIDPTGSRLPPWRASQPARPRDETPEDPEAEETGRGPPVPHQPENDKSGAACYSFAPSARRTGRPGGRGRGAARPDGAEGSALVTQQVGKYPLNRKLATGGNAEVYPGKAAGPRGLEKD